MKDLLKEAIAEAKAVRETAMANAKLALEEAFTPRIQSMISAKLSEEADEEMYEEEEAEMQPEPEPEPDSVEEGEDEEMYEGEEEEMHEEEEEMYEGEDEEMYEEEEDLDLESIIRELEEEDDDDMTMENVDSSDIGTGDNKKPSKDASDATTEDPQGTDLFEELSLDEIISALREEEEEEMHEEEEEEAAPAKELEEAYNVIRFLKGKLNEVNLLNAKLLFSNKLFRNNELSERQKMKVIENFDRATTMREVKLVYTTLAESLSTRKGKAIVKESKGIASIAQKSTAPAKRVLNEGNDLAARWKKLANLK
jgi:hypothetical protein